MTRSICASCFKAAPAGEMTKHMGANMCFACLEKHFGHKPDAAHIETSTEVAAEIAPASVAAESSPASVPAQATSPLVGWGVFGMIGGLAVMLFALTMDVSVDTGYQRVANLQLMNERLAILMFGGVIFLAGAISAVAGSLGRSGRATG